MRMPYRWVLVATGILLLAAIALWWQAPAAPERALAALYAAPRTLALRIPMARSAPLAPVPRLRSKVSVHPPPAMLTAEAQIAREIQRHPRDPRWTRLRARAALLRWDYNSALDDLDPLQLSSPDPSAAMPDLAIAYFERAESAGLPADYAQALELFAGQLQFHPNDLETLFNAGIVYRQLHLPLDAAAAWKRYLELDARSAWAAEVRARLAEVEAELRHFDAPIAESDETLLAAADFHALSTTRAHEFIARHGDPFLAGLLSAPRPNSALAALAAAAAANRRSDADAALAPARSAMAAFQAAGNFAGTVRASLEYVYAMQRASRACRAESAAVLRDAEKTRSPWLQGQSLLALVSCSDMTGDFADGPRLAERAGQIAASAGYPILALRASGLLAGTFSAFGRASDAWQADHRGLDVFWSGAFPAERAYQFYYDLSTMADDDGHYETARAMLAHAVLAIAHTAYRPVEALARQKLARAESRCGHYAEAASQWKLADRLFAALPQTPTTEFYRMQGEVGMLRMQSQRSPTGLTLDVLRAFQPRIAEHSGQLTAMQYYLLLAETEWRSGLQAAAEKDLTTVVDTAERTLDRLSRGPDRLTWGNLVSDAYRVRVGMELDRSDPTRALAFWEWARASEIRHRTSNDSADRVETLRATLDHQAVLSFAEIGGRLAVWLYSDRDLHFAWAKPPAAEIARLSARFSALCSDPRSDPRILKETGKQIYAALLARLAPWLDPQRELLVEPDGPVAATPFEALPLPDGRFLGERFAVITSPGLYYRGAEPSPPDAPGAAPLIVGAPTLPFDVWGELPPLPEALEEARSVASGFPSATLLTGPAATLPAIARALPSAGLFHFAGHALYTSQRSALLLAPGAGTTGIAPQLDSLAVAAMDLRRCRLAVLSGCSTGRLRDSALSDPDSLVRAFLAAGARSVIASRWNVDSHSTQLFMQVFYRALDRGNDPARALALAAAALRSRPETLHPFYWAAFTIFGAG